MKKIINDPFAFVDEMLTDLIILLGNRGRIMSAVDALMYPSFILGSHGAIAAMLSATPVLCMEMTEAIQKGIHALGRQVHEKLLPLWNAIFTDNRQPTSSTA